MPELEERVLYVSQRYSWPKALQIKPGRQRGPSGWWQGSWLCWGIRSGPLFLKAPQTALLKHEGAFIPGKVMPFAIHASIMLFIFSYLHYWNPVSLHFSCILPFPSPLTYTRSYLTPSSILFSISKLSPLLHTHTWAFLLSESKSDHCISLILVLQLCPSPMPDLASSFGLFHTTCALLPSFFLQAFKSPLLDNSFSQCLKSIFFLPA